MRKKILFLAGMMACCSLAGAQEISKTWVADKGNGTYQNPVLHADYSDPVSYTHLTLPTNREV